MQASRLLSILMLLQTRGRMSASALATELEVTQRTILRDIDQLSHAGVPIWAERGRDGGFQLREGWQTHLTGLTEHEAQALFLAGLPSAAAQLGLAGASYSARLKILASLPDNLRADAERVNARLHFDPIDWFREEAPEQHLHTMAHCVWNQYQVEVSYISWQGVKTQKIKPLGLVLKAGVWYVMAMPEQSKNSRIYKLSNIQSMNTDHVYFKYPKNFKLAQSWVDSVKKFETEIYQGSATLKVNQRGLKKLKNISAVVAKAVETSLTCNELHEMHVTIPIESIDYAANQLLGIGADIHVMTPTALREKIKKLAQELVEIYVQ